MSRPWIIWPADLDQVRVLSEALSISKVTASVLLARGMNTLEHAQRLMSGEGDHSHDPFLLPDMERAVDRFRRAITNGERICFYGDYDVDGITATSLYLTVFGAAGANASVYIPHRVREGYGLNGAALNRLRREGVTLLVTSDCGTTSHREVDLAGQLGLDVIITDHHQLDGRMPSALAVVNPHRQDSQYPFRELCSAALAYKVAQAYQVKYKGGVSSIDEAYDLVALATVADVMPLQEENRRFVREGLRQLSIARRCGIRALKQEASVTSTCTAGTVAFKLAPRINAAGRLAHAEMAVQLLTTTSEREAVRLAGELEMLNRERQRIEESTKLEAMAMLEAGPAAPGIVVHARHWHVGVVGIVAARLVDRFHRPSIALAVDEQGIAKGSARSVPGFDLYDALSQCRSLLLAFGGHPSAAGLTLRESNIPAFSEAFASVAADHIGQEPQKPGLRVDVEVGLNDITHRLVQELDLLQPYGAGNPEPTLAARNLSVLEARVVGGSHLRLMLRQKHSAPFVGIGFRMGSLAERGLSLENHLDVAFIPELDRWNGRERVQLRIRDLRASQHG